MFELTTSADGLRDRRWSTIPLALVVVMLLGSVLIPARQSWRILHLLRETSEVIEPARLVGARLDFGLTVEAAALESYALSGDSLQLARYIGAVADDDRRLATLEGLARSLDAEAIDRAASVRNRVDQWRALSGRLADGSLPRAQFASQSATRQAIHQAALRDLSRLAAYLAAEGSARRDLIRGSERLGLLVNAALVLIALAAVFAVGALSRRARRLTTILQLRVEEEATLRDVARALGAAMTTGEVLQCVAEGATATTHVASVYVECIAPHSGVVDSVVHDRGAPCLRQARRPLGASLTETIMAPGSGGSLTEMDSLPPWMIELASLGTPHTGLVAPLSSPDRTFGALVLLRSRTGGSFGDAARRQIHTLADLASAALQRVATQQAERRALEEAQLRARQESALREAADALAAAFTIEEVTEQIARTALDATQARTAFIEQVETKGADSARILVVRAAVGDDAPMLGSGARYSGSCTELVLRDGQPMLISDVARPGLPCTLAAWAGANCSAIVVPLGNARAPVGALFVLSAPQTPFGPDDLARAQAFGDLAALAYEKVRLLDEAREGRQRLERVMSSRSRLMRGFSHDVKNPLNAADGYAELLTAGVYGALSSEQKESLGFLRRSIHGALALIDDLHELARAETGRLELMIGSADLGTLLRASEAEYRAAAEASGLSLEVAAGPLTIETDAARVRQIIGNLLSNAIKYTARGSIVLRVGQRAGDHSGDPCGGGDEWAVIDVNDTGRGIPADKRDVIFEEFTRLGALAKPGVGLGLAISQRLAHALGGRITVASEVGVGSTFTLWLPIKRAESPVPAAS